MLMWPYMVVGVMNLLITTGLLVFYASSVNVQIPNMIILIAILGEFISSARSNVLCHCNCYCDSL